MMPTIAPVAFVSCSELVPLHSWMLGPGLISQPKLSDSQLDHLLISFRISMHNFP
jgi:hypothetical protein